jgi:hypothetical protein
VLEQSTLSIASSFFQGSSACVRYTASPAADPYQRLSRAQVSTGHSLLHLYIAGTYFFIHKYLPLPLTVLQSANREDPLSLPTFKHLAEGLPYAKHVHSKLLCSVTHALMTDANPPIVLPNGWVVLRWIMWLEADISGGTETLSMTHCTGTLHCEVDLSVLHGCRSHVFCC